MQRPAEIERLREFLKCGELSEFDAFIATPKLLAYIDYLEKQLKPSPSEDVRVLRGKPVCHWEGVDIGGVDLREVLPGQDEGDVKVTIRRIPKEEASQGEA